jgi:hypothetical protein
MPTYVLSLAAGTDRLALPHRSEAGRRGHGPSLQGRRYPAGASLKLRLCNSLATRLLARCTSRKLNPSCIRRARRRSPALNGGLPFSASFGSLDRKPHQCEFQAGTKVIPGGYLQARLVAGNGSNVERTIVLLEHSSDSSPLLIFMDS